MLDDKDPTGATRLKEWANGLRELPPGTPPPFEYQRMIHPGIVPADGDGPLAAEGQGLLGVPGEHIQSVTVLHYLRAGSPSDQFDIVGRDAMFGALLTLVTDRRCQVVPEVMARVEGQEHPFTLPLAGSVDTHLGAPLPAWPQVDAAFRDAVARLTSLPDDDMRALSAAIHMHYCASLLIPRDLVGAYALMVGGIECLAQHFGSPPTEWAYWDESASWEKFIAGQAFTEDQAAALRARLMKDKHIKLAETSATYAMTRLPDAFWQEPVRVYTWGVDAMSASPLEGSWSDPQPRGAVFAENPAVLKAALKTAYKLRSQFLHAGKRAISFAGDVFATVVAADRPAGESPRLSVAQMRAVLRTLILQELTDRGSTDPRGLDEITLDTVPTPGS
ncbi:hypothetical protein GCM10010123_46240 [Pilimelia anulata]|uniref:Uncharacterized protein n=1 Tax=Pilimelia anulata TaxID=53371 RepID=A0A8J3BH98_9ACTN|nr:hypothetical protein [Pilimelia anulata]GGK11013.1 hypothetical protein GCM10010123_46240 [Pilimelia anulata]